LDNTKLSISVGINSLNPKTELSLSKKSDMKERFNLFLGNLKNLLGKSALSKIVFIAIGISSTIWFLIRVIPKP
jgi:Ca2+-binding EF-hand superfamily protein